MLPLQSRLEVEVAVGKAFLESVLTREHAGYFAEYANKLAKDRGADLTESSDDLPKETATVK